MRAFRFWRILRALRFSAQLDFEIDENTKEAIRNQAEFLKDISAERINTKAKVQILFNEPFFIFPHPFFPTTFPIQPYRGEIRCSFNQNIVIFYKILIYNLILLYKLLKFNPYIIYSIFVTTI